MNQIILIIQTKVIKRHIIIMIIWTTLSQDVCCISIVWTALGSGAIWICGEFPRYGVSFSVLCCTT
jgi:hypothetical protein